MIKRISTTLLILVAIGLVMNFTFKNDNNRRLEVHPNVVISGFEDPVIRNAPVINAESDNNMGPIYYSDSVMSFVDVRTGPESIYDLQSNGVTQQVWQDPNNPENIHAVYMVNLTPGWPAADRRCYYMFSSDYGATWTDYGPNPVSGSNGFCVCDGLSDGAAVIGGHTNDGGGAVRFQIFADVAPGAGSFVRLDPGENPFNSLQNIWGRIKTTSSVNNTNKVVMMASINVTGADTMASDNRSLSLTTSSFAGWRRQPDVNNAETYSFARGSDGRIGLAYVMNDFNVNDNGKVRYTFSTDDGNTWASPITIWNPTPYLDGVFGCLRGVTLTYQGTTPKVAFELMGLTATGYYPSGRAAIGFWAPDVNGSIAYVTPFDSAWSNNGNGGATDVMTSICRPSISRSSDGQLLIMAFAVSRADTDAIGSHFYDVYISTSSNSGSNWHFPPTKVTNTSGPLRDNRFASLSPSNDITAGSYYANLIYQSDSIPGSVTQTPPAAESLAKQRFSRIKFHPSVIGINTISTEVPKGYSLNQNYPNPFNPVTKIRFALPQSGNVTLKVFNAVGQVVAVLANNVFTNAGVKEIDFNGNGFASGIYFYSISVGDFTQTKKMVLVK